MISIVLGYVIRKISEEVLAQYVVVSKMSEKLYTTCNSVENRLYTPYIW